MIGALVERAMLALQAQEAGPYLLLITHHPSHLVSCEMPLQR